VDARRLAALSGRGPVKNARGRVLLPVRLKRGRVELKALLKTLGDLGVNYLLAEGGGELAWSLLHDGLVDRLYWIVAPKLMGGRQAITSVEGRGFSSPGDAVRVKRMSALPLGEDWLFVGDL
jgi:diaminohydroxyphosphoribosylaminopyrimidine deaminase/5-amino-6-(5-phosphoribosylamino)uracil reductase